MYALDVACFEAVYRFSRATMRWAVSAKKALVIVAEEGGVVVGFVVVHVERGGVGYVVTLDVEAARRGRGVAGELMRRVEAEACEAGCVEMVLHVSVGNEGAVRFYERAGYVRAGRAKGFYGEGGDGWIYRKELRAS